MKQTNLLQETIHDLTKFGKSPSDVEWVGTETEWITWENFEKIASNYTYYSGYGGQEVNQYLNVVGVDWWLERYEYNGFGWWVFKTFPAKPSKEVNSLDLDYAYESDDDSDD